LDLSGHVGKEGAGLIPWFLNGNAWGGGFWMRF